MNITFQEFVYIYTDHILFHSVITDISESNGMLSVIYGNLTDCMHIDNVWVFLLVKFWSRWRDKRTREFLSTSLQRLIWSVSEDNRSYWSMPLAIRYGMTTYEKKILIMLILYWRKRFNIELEGNQRKMMMYILYLTLYCNKKVN